MNSFVTIDSGGDGGIFLGQEDFQRMFDESLPAGFFILFFILSGDQRACTDFAL